MPLGCETAREARRSERGNIDGAMICTKRCLGGREAWKRKCNVAPLPQISRLIFGPGENGFIPSLDEGQPSLFHHKHGFYVS